MIKWEMVYDPIEEKGALKPDKFRMCIELGDAMADKLLEEPKPRNPENSPCH